jgi:hypothetical protein
MCDRIVRVSDLAEFTAEVRKDLPIRLTLTSISGKGPIPTQELQLHLQGHNDLGEIIWLMESHRIVWIRHEPETPLDKSIYTGMRELERIVRKHLEDHGYEIRPGSYGIQDDIKPINGQYEIVKWQKGNADSHFDDLQTWTVVPLDQNESVCTQTRAQ